MKINSQRLMDEIETYSTYGQQANGGITRPSFSEKDFEVRSLFIRQLKALGMDVRVDAIANIWGTIPGNGTSEHPIAVGSHLDTVPNGGKFDGALGVLAAKEIVQTLQENHIVLNHPLQVVSFTAEESNEFNFSTMGSRAFTGKLATDDLQDATNSEGLRLQEAVARAGGNLANIGSEPKTALAAFFELHIEQGRKLEKRNLPIGIVNSIVGIHRDLVTVRGDQNHSGTTMMEDRRDALAAAGEMVITVQKLAKELQTDAVATVGKFEVLPNAANIIPGQVDFTLEVRSADRKERQALVNGIHQSFEEIRNRHGVEVTLENIYDTREQEFDRDLIGFLKDAAETADIPYAIMPSMAGHDAMHLTEHTKTAMLFVKSVKGVSHNPEELSLAEDIERSVNVLLHAILLADRRL
ncbi:MAG TPA: M20 family metallo-hydrolase [Planococcus sp. (in: firmicutes)]|nr:M20 family metallo-hydrolase [Planococcus sp. (in: firmicutes)]